MARLVLVRPMRTFRRRPAGRFRGVVLDLGNTLVNERDFNRIERIAQESGLPVDADGLAHAYQEGEEEYDRRAGRIGPDEFWKGIIERCAPTPPSSDALAAFCRRIRVDEPSVEVFSDVGLCLEELTARELALGVLTSGRPEASARRLLETLGLARFFRTVVSAETEGMPKPDPRIFRRAAERLGTEPSATVYVGDLMNLDARAAASAGLTAVWLHRGGTGWIDEPPEITTLLELPGWIDRVEAESGRSR